MKGKHLVSITLPVDPWSKKLTLWSILLLGALIMAIQIVLYSHFRCTNPSLVLPRSNLPLQNFCWRFPYFYLKNNITSQWASDLNIMVTESKKVPYDSWSTVSILDVNQGSAKLFLIKRLDRISPFQNRSVLIKVLEIKISFGNQLCRNRVKSLPNSSTVPDEISQP